jgi:hypothetical protein
MSPSSRPRRASIGEVVDLTKRYALQEIVGPLRNIGRQVGIGLAGALLLGIGMLTLLVGLLRLLQTETGDVFDGNWSFVPYVIVLIVTIALMAIVATRIQKHGLTPREPRQ